MFLNDLRTHLPTFLDFIPEVYKMDHEETGCQPPLEGPILCVNNCGFFGSPANMNMCSKCYKDTVLKQEQAASIEDIVNGSSSSIVKNEKVEIRAIAIESQPSKSAEMVEPKLREGRMINRCNTCKKRVGLTAFKCRCGDIFCGAHRYSDKHGCLFDYRMAGRDEIARANPVVKGEKLDKI